MVFRVLTDVLSFNFFTILSLARKTEIWIDVWCQVTFKNHFSHMFTFISHYFIKMVCISIILAHMLASLDCVTRQECWEPFLPKHLKQSVIYHHRKDNHWSIDVGIKQSFIRLQTTNKDHLRDDRWHESVTSPHQPHVATWSTRKNSFSHITNHPKHDNLCLQRSSKWNIWWIPCGHTF